MQFTSLAQIKHKHGYALSDNQDNCFKGILTIKHTFKQNKARALFTKQKYLSSISFVTRLLTLKICQALLMYFIGYDFKPQKQQYI